MSEQMSEEANGLVLDIGRLIVENARFRDRRWDSLTQIYSISDGGKRGHGYRYEGEDWSAEVPEGFEVLKTVAKLRDAMAKSTEQPWRWARLTIVAPEMKIAIEFAYDENPWEMGGKSLDMSDYAMSVRSEDHPMETRCT